MVIIKGIKNNPLGTMNVCAIFNGNPSNSSDISVGTVGEQIVRLALPSMKPNRYTAHKN